MKNLLITEIFPPKIGGSGRWFWEVYSRLSNKDFIIAAGANKQSDSVDSTINIRCVRWPLTLPTWSIMSSSGIIGYLRLVLLLRSLIIHKDIAAIHCGRCLPEGLLGWVAWKWAGIPYLCYVHGEELPTYKSSREYNYLSRLVYSNARRIIVNSENTKRSFINYTKLSTESVRLMYPGVDTTYFCPKSPDLVIRNELAWTGRKVILTVGRLQKRKGHDYTILALKRIKEQIPDILYAIAGDGDEWGYLEELTAKENLQQSVQFLGRVDDDILLSCYQQCDLFVLANREVNGDFEGFGMVLLEAQACGKPVIAGRSGGTAETMMPEETGMLVDSDNPDAIADSVIHLMRDNKKRALMGQRAVEWVRANFDWNTLVVQAKNIFNELKMDR